MKDSKKQEYVDLLHRTICGQIHVCSEGDHCRSEDWSINRSTHERVLVEEGGKRVAAGKSAGAMRKILCEVCVIIPHQRSKV